MALISSCLSLLTDFKIIFGLVIFVLVYRVASFYIRVYSLPSGPFPYPFVGNLLSLEKTGQNWSVVLNNLAKTYGPVFTVWYGETPRVMVTDIDLLRDKFKRNEFSGRGSDLIIDVFHNNSRQELVAADYGPDWESVKRVYTTTVVRFATTEMYNELVIDCVDHTVDLMVKTEGLNKPFVPFEYIFDMFLTINAKIAFGPRYELTPSDYKVYVRALKTVYEEFDDIMGIWEFFPITRFGKRFKKFRKIWDDLSDLCINRFVDHYKDYDANVIRDFCDTLITAKNEAINKNKTISAHLSDNNLGMAVADVFFAGTDAYQYTFRWILLHMLYNEDFLAKLRHEIDVEIGDRMPTHEDKTRCHYVMAFISEVFRYFYPAPIQVPHKAVVTTKLGDHVLPQGTEVVCLATVVMTLEENFSEAHVFRPERWLQDNGDYVLTKPKAYIPFGVGRRICAGEKIAINTMFLALVRFIQKTNKYRIGIDMDENEPLIPDPNDTNVFGIPPKPFSISLNTI